MSKGDFDEGKHPRADDGKFGHGTAAGASGRKPKGKPGAARGSEEKPAAKKPAAKKPKAAPAKFDAAPHQKTIAKHRAAEAKHRTASLDTKKKMAAIKAKAKGATPKQKAALKTKFETLKAKREELKTKANEAKAARLDATKAMQEARVAHREKLKADRAKTKPASKPKFEQERKPDAPASSGAARPASASPTHAPAHPGHTSSASGSLELAFQGGGMRRDSVGHPVSLSPEAQKAARDHFNGVVAKHGLATKFGEKSHMLVTQRSEDMGGGFAARYGNGTIAVSPAALRGLARHSAKDMADTGRRLAGGADAAADPAFIAYHAMIHETVHDHGPKLNKFDRAEFLITEEMTTEMSAREISAREYGISGHQLRGAGYDDEIEHTLGDITKLTGVTREKAFDAMAKASLKFKRGSGDMMAPAALAQVANDTLDALGHTDDATRKKLLNSWTLRGQELIAKYKS